MKQQTCTLLLDPWVKCCSVLSCVLILGSRQRRQQLAKRDSPHNKSLFSHVRLCSAPGSSVHGDSPGQNTGVGCHLLLQKIYPTQGFNRGLLHCRWILYHCPIQEMQGGKSSSSNTFQVPVLHLLTPYWPE